MLSEAKIVIQEAEDLILGEYREDIPNFVSKLMNDFSYISVGLKRLFLPIKRFLIIYVPLILTTLILSSCFSIEKETKGTLMVLSFIIPILMVVFARPSNFCFELITDSLINKLIASLKLNGITHKSQLDSFRKTIDLAKDRTIKRNKNFNWLFATYVAISAYMFGFYFKLVFSIGEFDFQAFIDSATLPVMLFILLTPFFYMLISSYKKANDAVFQLIYLSLNKLESNLNKQSESKAKRKRRKPSGKSRGIKGSDTLIF